MPLIACVCVTKADDNDLGMSVFLSFSVLSVCLLVLVSVSVSSFVQFISAVYTVSRHEVASASSSFR